MRPSVRGLFLLQALALGAVAGVAVLALGLPLAARQALGLPGLALLSLLVALAVFGVGALLLLRSTARPVDRLLSAAARLRAGAGDLPILGGEGDRARGDGAGSLERPAVAFERLAAALAEERERLAAKVRELTASNAALAAAREGLLRAERLATVGRIAAGLAHEVGNPLGAVTGYAELAKGMLPPGCDPELPGALERIAAAAARIDRTVRDLLDLARPMPPALGPVSLAGAVETALRLARGQARFREVEVEVALPPTMPAVLADEHRLVQVLLNLLLNASDAMKGRGKVRVTALTGPPSPPSPLPPGEGEQRPVHVEEGELVFLTVEDTGPGIAEADLPRVFESLLHHQGARSGHGPGPRDRPADAGVVRRGDRRSEPRRGRRVLRADAAAFCVKLGATWSPPRLRSQEAEKRCWSHHPNAVVLLHGQEGGIAGDHEVRSSLERGVHIDVVVGIRAHLR